MIKSLRRKHIQLWSLMAFLLPLGIISAWLAVPKQVADRLLQPALTTALPVILKSSTNDFYTVNIRVSKDRSAVQLEWINKSPLTSPSGLIFKTAAQSEVTDPEGADLIGRIGNRGTYHFPLKSESAENGFHFILYDIIHHRVIDRINF